MELIDTHTHLYLEEFGPDPKEVVERALGSGIRDMVMPNVSLATIGPMKELAHRYPSKIHMAMGLHPTEIGEGWCDDLSVVRAELDSSERYMAIGEIGIDLYWDNSRRDEQMQAFETQIRWAAERNMPVIIHCRDGLDETLEVLESVPPIHAVFHSFGGSKSDVELIRKTGDYYFGINGIVTFKNSRLRDSLPVIGIDRILLETDSPYLAPVPFRGKRNESSYIVHVASHVAEHMNMHFEDVAAVTTASAKGFFGLI